MARPTDLKVTAALGDFAFFTNVMKKSLAVDCATVATANPSVSDTRELSTKCHFFYLNLCYLIIQRSESLAIKCEDIHKHCFIGGNLPSSEHTCTF